MVVGRKVGELDTRKMKERQYTVVKNRNRGGRGRKKTEALVTKGYVR